MRHVPKKLTDCPENLRESIDWLIQVRHGNGEGGKGLDELAKALKKLIEEAISNATKSLDERESKLRCTGKDPYTPSDASSPGSPVQPCCKKQDEEIKKHEESLKSKNGSDNDQINALKSQIKKAQDAKNDCAKTHYISEDERQKGLDEVKQQRKIVEKLSDFKETLTGNNDILTHLCDGLEKFLGYDVNSKGYDGTGIVYSDLDRLCDGVMGFLFEIISEVNNNENLKKYNNNIDNILESIKQAKYNRKTHFDSSIRDVNNNVVKWVNAVTLSNLKITTPLDNLQNTINSHIAVDMNDEPISDQLSTWQGFSSLYLVEAERSETALNEIDENLKDTLAPRIELLREVAQNFWNSVNDPKVDEAVRELIDNFTEIPEQVKNHVETKMMQLHGTLNENFNKVDAQIKNVRKEQSTQIKNIRRAVTTAKLLADDLVGKTGNDFGRYIKNVTQKFDEIQTEIEKFTNGGVTLLTNFETVQQKVSGLEGDVRDGLQKLKESINELADTLYDQTGSNDLVSNALSQLTKAKQKIDASLNATLALSTELNTKYNVGRDQFGGKFTTLTKQVSGIDIDPLKEGLRHLADEISGPLQQLENIHTSLRDELESKLSNVHDQLGGDVSTLKRQINAQLETYITGDLGTDISANLKQLTDPIATASGGAASLVEIVTEIGKYAGAFETKFRTVIGDIVDKMMEGGEESGTIRGYFIMSNGVAGAHDKVRVVKAAIRKNIVEISRSISQPASNKDVVATLNSIHTYIQGYANAIRPDKNLAQIASKVVEEPDVKKLSLKDSNANLRQALQNVLATVHEAIGGAAKEVRRFIDGCKIGNVTQAIAKINEIGEDMAKQAKNTKATNLGNTIKDKLTQKVDAAEQFINQFAQVAAKKTAEHFKNALERQIKGQSNDGIHTRISGEIGKLRAPTTVNGDDKFQKAFKEFEQKLGKLTLAANTASQTQTQVQQLVTELFVAVGDLDTEIDTFDDAAKTSILAAAQRTIDIVVTKFETVGGDAKKINVARMMTQFEDARNTLQDAVENIQDELTKLKGLPSTVTGKQEAASKIMEELKLKVQAVSQKINAIENPIRAAEEAFETAMSKLERALQDAQIVTNSVLPVVKKELQATIRKAFNDIEDSVRKMFNAQRKADFESLKNCITERIPQIKDIIERDSASGLKGLMNKLQEPLNKLHGSGTRLRSYAGKVKIFCEEFFDDLKSQSDHSPRLTPLADALSDLLSTMHSQRHFDAAVSRKLAELQTQLDTLTPTKFSEASPLLNVVRAGVRAFHGELAKQYVSRYSGETIEWTKNVEGSKPLIKEPTGEALKCGKVFLTCVQMLLDDLSELKEQCTEGGSWCKKQINRTNHLGLFLDSRGFVVSTTDGNQNGELRNKSECTGDHIGLMLATTTVATTGNYDTCGIISCLLDNVKVYYRTCHLGNTFATKTPTTVNQMLQWLSGLPYTTVYDELSFNGFEELFEEPKDEANESTAVEGITAQSLNKRCLEAHPEKINVAKLSNTLTEVCHYSYDVLIAVQGHGHAEGVYACDFNTNRDKLSYPSRPGACIQLLAEVLSRLHHQLYFLFNMCYYDTQHSGWRSCWYGRGIAGSGWKCNTKLCPNQEADQEADQKHDQTCKQKCNQKAECGLKSPLQSFLEDGLQGFLPHPVKAVGCGETCSLSNHRGIPCKTPMGFGDLSVVASHCRTGEHIKKVLYEFCGKSYKPLSQMCSYLACIFAMPPKTLGDMFGFYYNLLNDWNNSQRNSQRKEHTETAFNKAISNANFEDPATTLDVKPLFGSDNHKSDKLQNSHLTGDLYALVKCNYDSKSAAGHPCGPYLRPLCRDISVAFSKDHADKYVSWVVYITETFHQLLKALYDECNGKCGGDRPQCRVVKCNKDCKATKSAMSPESTHNESCGSIVDCQYTLPTLFKFGFVYENIDVLSEWSGKHSSKRTCKDLCMALEKVINERETVGAALAKLIYRTIPDFLFKIRAPFIWLNVALWLLSLLYLLHIMVIRLDLLHIKSHLHSPSSHRIAAQSLLAAARVNKLNRVFYLQP